MTALCIVLSYPHLNTWLLRIAVVAVIGCAVAAPRSHRAVIKLSGKRVCATLVVLFGEMLQDPLLGYVALQFLAHIHTGFGIGCCFEKLGNCSGAAQPRPGNLSRLA